jgi:hypothetical protein
MIVGFNHNVHYRGVGFHVQTEDSGQKNPQLVTLLYHGGTIIASQKTVYADILKVDNLDQVIEDLAKEQHKGMLRKLTKGEFDQRIIDFGIPLGPSAGGGQQPQSPAASAAPPAKSVAPSPEGQEDSPPATAAAAKPAIKSVKPAAAKSQPPTAPVKIVEEPNVDKFRKPKPAAERTLDDLIYAYLTGADH